MAFVVPADLSRRHCHLSSLRFACLSFLFQRTRSGLESGIPNEKTGLKPRARSGSVLCGLRRQRSASTEDLWSEDQYLPEAYLPAPDYMVSVNAVQPSGLTVHFEINVI